MADYGVTEKGFVIKRLDEILEEIHTDLTDGFGFNTRLDPQSFLNVLVTTFGGKISELWEVAQNSYYAKYPSTAEGSSLDNAVQYGGIRRAPNKYSYYKLHCTGIDGTIVRQGAVVATNTAPQMKLNSVAEFEITRNAFNKAVVKVAAEETGQIYAVSINGTQYSYTSQSSDALAILQGLAAVITASGYTVSVDTTNVLLTIADQTVSRSGVLVLSDNLTTASVTVIADFATNEYGRYIFPNGTITEIVTVITGLEKVENLIIPTYGRLQETDVELRHSYLAKSAIRSTRMIDSICSQLIDNVANVESATGYENDTDNTDSEGRPPHSVEIVVDGGDESEIATVILDKKAAGIQTYGSVTVNVATEYGDTVPISFNRPEYVYVWMKITLDADASHLPTNYANLTIDSVVSDAASLHAGDNLLAQTFNDGIYATVGGVTYVDIKCATTTSTSYVPDDDEYTHINVAVTSRQKAVVTDTRIEVVYSGNS